MKNQRILSPQEKNYLIRHGKSKVIDRIVDYGEMPVEYITGIAEFGNMNLFVNKNVLIPRLETELLVKICLKEIAKHNLSEFIIADVGTGSGVIGISLFRFLITQNWQGKIIMSDIHKKALDLAKKNFRKISKEENWPDSAEEQCVFLHSDLFDDYPTDISFNLIVANLPYIPSRRLSKLNSSVKDFEPMLALDGGVSGDQIIKKLLNQAKKYLKKDGIMILEIDHKSNISSWPDDYEYSIVEDQFNKQRFVICESAGTSVG